MTLLGIMLSFGNADASTYTYDLSPSSQITSLNTDYLYLWGINWNLPQNQVIQSATISFTDIRETSVDFINIFKVFLLDNPTFYDSSVDVIRIADYGSTSPNREIPGYPGTRLSADTFVGEWHYSHSRGQWGCRSQQDDSWERDDEDGWWYKRDRIPDSLSFSIDVNTLTQYLLSANALSNSNFGIGFDPDCHYSTLGVHLNIVTADRLPTPPNPVPEPGTFLLLGSAIATLALAKRKLG